jgi:DNA polymerase III sliding clamp (beta) subunit (PCNA family)
MTALVHRASLQHVCRLLGSASKDDVVELGYQGTSLAFRVDADIEIVVRTVDAQYPNINHVIRRSLQKVHTCCVSTHELRLAVERIHAALVDPAEDPLIVEFRGDGLVLQSRAAEWGHVSTVLPLVTHADTRGTRIAFSVNLLHSSVRAIEQVVPQIELCYGDATSPLVMRADDSVMHILTLLMPRVLSD